MAAPASSMALAARSWGLCRRYAALRQLQTIEVTKMPHTMRRGAYAQMFGPTVGDRVRLADTELLIEVEKDFTTYGEEVKFGGGKVIRDSQGQSPLPGAALDLVI